MGAAVTNPQKRRRPTGGIAEAVASLLGADQWSVDRRLMQSHLVLSSSEAVRGAAAVWLQAFDAARAAGATEEEALASASLASPSRAPPG
jgi:hypothetical protein